MIILGYESRLNLISWVLKNGEPFLAMEKERCDYRKMVRKMHLKIREWSEKWFQGGRGRGHESRYTGSSKSWKSQGNGFSSRASRKRHNPVTTLILAQWHCQTSDLQKFSNEWVSAPHLFLHCLLAPSLPHFSVLHPLPCPSPSPISTFLPFDLHFSLFFFFLIFLLVLNLLAL